jgi:hypothetical protein
VASRVFQDRETPGFVHEENNGRKFIVFTRDEYDLWTLPMPWDA